MGGNSGIALAPVAQAHDARPAREGESRASVEQPCPPERGERGAAALLAQLTDSTPARCRVLGPGLAWREVTCRGGQTQIPLRHGRHDGHAVHLALLAALLRLPAEPAWDAAGGPRAH